MLYIETSVKRRVGASKGVRQKSRSVANILSHDRRVGFHQVLSSGDFLRQTCANQHANMSTENMSPASKDKADKMSKKRRREEEELAQQKKLKKSKKDRETVVKQEPT